MCESERERLGGKGREEEGGETRRGGQHALDDLMGWDGGNWWGLGVGAAGRVWSLAFGPLGSLSLLSCFFCFFFVL